MKSFLDPDLRSRNGLLGEAYLNLDRSYAVGAQLSHSHRHIWGVLGDHSPYVGLPSCQLRKSYLTFLL